MYKTREELRKAHEKEINDFSIVWAFSNEQFEEGIREKYGLNAKKKADLKKLCSIGMGGYMLKTDVKPYLEMLKRHSRELKEFNADFKRLVEEIKYEMWNHEYSYCPYEVEEEVREALGIYHDNPRFEEAWEKAKKEVLKAG